MFKTISALSLRQKLFVLTVVFIPYSTIYLFGNPYLFLPMVLFVGYLLLSFKQVKGLLKTKGSERLFYPWIIIWILILIGIVVNFMPDYVNIYRSVLQRRIIYLVFFIVAFNEFKRTPYILNVIDYAIVISVSLMALFYFTGFGVKYTLDDRLIIFGAGINSIGVWSVFGIIILLDKIVHTKFKRLSLIFYLAIILGAFFVIVSTGSRKSLIMLLVGTLFYLIFLNRPLVLKLKLIILFLILSFYGFNYVVTQPVFQNRFRKEMERQNLGGRLPIWEETIKIIKENPIIGAGPGLIREELVDSSLGKSRAAHNEFITIAGLSGIPGLFIFIYFLLLMGKNAYSVNKRETSSTSLPFIFWILALMYLSTAGGALNSFTTWFLFAYISAKSLVKSVDFKNVYSLRNVYNI